MSTEPIIIPGIFNTMRRPRMIAIGQVLAKYRKGLHYTQKDVARQLKERFSMEVTVPALSHWEKGYTVPNAPQLLALCEIYKIRDINDAFQICMEENLFAGLNEEGREKVYEYARIMAKSGMFKKEAAQIVPFRRQIRKFYLKASAGTGQYLDSDAYDIIEAGDEVPALADFGITLAGNSMEPQFINGQTVWVHTQETLNSGEIGIFYFNGDAYCKKYVEKDNEILLVSLNPAYPPMSVGEDSTFRILGKVVG